MTERKRPRPPWVETIQLPGHDASRGEPKPEHLVEDVRQGVQGRLFTAGALLPEAPQLRRMYALSQDGIRDALSCLRREGITNLHDEYEETYFIDDDYIRDMGQESR
ncbi:GntR family transcriptional regulator [Streptomyces tailanensis]|uniref:GntR family transcriptional regulator n=1 Tax=Streptomyces tailanensis TaxID=2569858 RepID=UPI00122E2AF7|nr:GntR family transcriptional regulator [Streptomyces tailanensis]